MGHKLDTMGEVVKRIRKESVANVNLEEVKSEVKWVTTKLAGRSRPENWGEETSVEIMMEEKQKKENEGKSISNAWERDTKMKMKKELKG